jgi:hypothetical protein
MLLKEEIKDGQLVYSPDNNTYHVVDNVGNAREKGDRCESSTPKDELSYDIVDIVTGKIYEGICEVSGKTLELCPATVEDVRIYLKLCEANAYTKLAKANKEFVKIQAAINNFENSINS